MNVLETKVSMGREIAVKLNIERDEVFKADLYKLRNDSLQKILKYLIAMECEKIHGKA